MTSYRVYVTAPRASVTDESQPLAMVLTDPGDGVTATTRHRVSGTRGMRASVSPLAQDRRGRWIPWAFVAFFGVVLAVNGAMIVIAMATWPGLETESAYQRGLGYNRAIAAAAEQAKLGWQVDFAFEQDGDRSGIVRLDLADRFGNLLQRAEVEATFVRPAQDGYDLVVEVPHEHAGRYRAGSSCRSPGQWEMRVTISERGREYRLRERIYVAP